MGVWRGRFPKKDFYSKQNLNNYMMKGDQNMYKKIFSIYALLLVMTMAFAMAQAGIHESGTGLENPELRVVNQGIGQGLENQAIGQIIKVQSGIHMNNAGQMMKIQQQENKRMRLEVEGVAANCDCNMTQERVKNKTKLFAKLSNGKNAEIKVMPNTASERALKRLRLKVCSEENGCQIELKEVGVGNKTQLAYELKTQRKSKVFGLFKAQMRVEAQVDAETGEIIQVKKPWWAFLASEPVEEESESTEEA